jgi:hypothetical protein
MNRNWTDFKSLHSNLAGAREAFEDACETLFRKIHHDKHVSQVKVKLGDGGIDIFIGELGNEPITVIQCKFFLESFGDSQHSQIRDSFKTAIESDKYTLKQWILCIPRVIDIDENAWWFKWKKKQIETYSKENHFIKLINGNELLDLFKEQNIYNQVFKIDEAIKIDEIHKALIPPKFISSEKNINQILWNNYSLGCEPFYLERQIDNDFLNAIKHFNIWLFGKSGFGKTALINRNLIKNSIECCICDLSPVTVNNKEDVLNEILINFEDKFQVKRNKEETNILKQICQILISKSFNNIVIVIDELSVSNNEVLKEISDSLLQLVIYFNNKETDYNLRFIISTIPSPTEIISNYSKASEKFIFMCCDNWQKDSIKLFNCLSESLNIEAGEFQSQILKVSCDSPRIIKNIFRKIVVSDNGDIQKSINLAIAETIN